MKSPGPVQRLLVRCLERYQQRGGGRELFRVACNFEPGCSEYARQAILLHGTRKGLALTLRRLRKCRHGDQVGRLSDPVPQREVNH